MSGGDWKEMYVAAQVGNLSLVQYHIDSGIDPNYQHPEILSTPLVTAILAGHTEVALFLLSRKADPHLRSYFDNMSAVEATLKVGNKELMNYFYLNGVQTSKTWWQKLKDRFK